MINIFKPRLEEKVIAVCAHPYSRAHITPRCNVDGSRGSHFRRQNWQDTGNFIGLWLMYISIYSSIRIAVLMLYCDIVYTLAFHMSLCLAAAQLETRLRGCRVTEMQCVLWVIGTYNELNGDGFRHLCLPQILLLGSPGTKSKIVGTNIMF